MKETIVRFRGAALLALVAVGGAAAPAAAQSHAPSPAKESRVFFAVGGGLGQYHHSTEAVRFKHPLFGPETGEIAADYHGGHGLAWEVSAGIGVAGNFAVGVSAGRLAFDRSADLVGKLPHPLAFDRLRTVEGIAESLANSELALDVEARWLIELSHDLEVTLFAGPSFVRLTTELVTGMQFDQAYPYDGAAFAGTDRHEWTKTLVGGHAGAEVAFYVSEGWGVGGTVRYRSASGELDRGDGLTTPLEAGGLQALAGLRLRF